MPRARSEFVRVTGNRWGILRRSYSVNEMQDVMVTREVLEVYDKYDGDFGLLDERWASVEDRRKVSNEQSVQSARRSSFGLSGDSVPLSGLSQTDSGKSSPRLARILTTSVRT